MKSFIKSAVLIALLLPVAFIQTGCSSYASDRPRDEPKARWSDTSTVIRTSDEIGNVMWGHVTYDYYDIVRIVYLTNDEHMLLKSGMTIEIALADDRWYMSSKGKIAVRLQ